MNQYTDKHKSNEGNLGFKIYTPQNKTQQMFNDVNAILEEYKDQLPLTIRQVFYRLVAKYGFQKTESAYTILQTRLGQARRGNLIPMEALRDDGENWIEPYGYSNSAEAVQSARNTLEYGNLNPKTLQPILTLVLCEAVGMAPMLSNVAKQYGVSALGMGGFPSITAKARLALELAKEPRPIRILQIGDHDPSGKSVYLNTRDDVNAFVAGYGGDPSQMSWKRVAVYDEQIEEYSLLTSPRKPSDNRNDWVGETAQAEAFPPDVLIGLLRNELDANFDRDLYDQRKAEFDHDQVAALAKFDTVFG